MILRKAPPIYTRGDHKLVTKFAFKPVQLVELKFMDPSTFDLQPSVIGDIIWLERYVETYVYTPKFSSKESDWTFVKSERYKTAFLNKLCE